MSIAGDAPVDGNPRVARRLAGRSIVVVLMAALIGLAASAAKAEDERDPFEPVNRAVFTVNDFLDQLLLRPMAIMYRTFVPSPVRTGIYNALGNLASPVVFANNVAQGDRDAAGNTFARFLVNSTIGIGGLIDVADGLGYPRADQDFGLTMARRGVGEGPYLMLPLLGPSNPRDAAGWVVDSLLDPLTYIAPTEALLARSGTAGVDFRERNLESIDDLRRTSLDYYAAVRSVYRQQRRSAAGLDPFLDDPAYEDIFREDFDD